jgi:pyruvate formate lyase activating enzyme
MYPASFYRPVVGRQVQCQLCPHCCTILPGQFGKCNTRTNRGGRLYTQSYGVLSAISSDPIEKKPLYHFYPGSQILSIGSFGCNLKCDYCQNCEISQVDEDIFAQHPARDPEDIVNKALLHRDNIGLAYTYNEPTVYYEYMMECAVKLKNHGKANVMVTNGFINKEPLEALLPHMDAFNIDLKSFRDEFYRTRASGRLNPVLETISRVASSDRHLELTFLIIPGYNDEESEWKEMIRWIENECGRDTILHVSKYFPRHRLRAEPTPTETMLRFLELARESIRYVYPGNNPRIANHTYCPQCGSLMIERTGYQTTTPGIDQEGRCTECQFKIKGSYHKITS